MDAQDILGKYSGDAGCSSFEPVLKEPAEVNNHSQIHNWAELDCLGWESLGWGSLELNMQDGRRLGLSSLDLQRLVDSTNKAAVVSQEVARPQGACLRGVSHILPWRSRSHQRFPCGYLPL